MKHKKLKVREMAKYLDIEKKEINQILYFDKSDNFLIDDEYFWSLKINKIESLKIDAGINKNTYLKNNCPKCGGNMVLRNGISGEFYGCSDFPNCRGTRSYWEK